MRIAKGYHILPIKPGMQLEVHEEIGEGNNKRIWRFKWLVVKVRKPNHPDGTFTMRGKTAGHTIEKIYPLSFPNFKKVILLDKYKIRRAKLYYIREKIGKDAKMKSILSKNEKNVDLLKLALEEIQALQKAFEETVPVEDSEASELPEDKQVKDAWESPDDTKTSATESKTSVENTKEDTIKNTKEWKMEKEEKVEETKEEEGTSKGDDKNETESVEKTEGAEVTKEKVEETKGE